MRKDKSFIGCFAFDNLPAFPSKFPAKFVINTGSVKTEGEHWVALLMNSKECLYFDSFGVPIMDLEIMKYIKDKYSSVVFSEVCIQYFKSKMCGQFCILFLRKVKNRKSFAKFINSFSHDNLLLNDKKLKMYLKKS